ncbi:MAG: prepilin-type N-terminal cleavage/methylation domain-containing protein [bacterium]
MNLMNKGFTLIELLIVVAIIAILAAIAVPNFLEAQTRSKVSRCHADMRTVSVGLESYSIDNNQLPPATQWNPDMPWGFNNYLWAKSTAPQVCKYLTTPIAYLSSLPIEPFSQGRLGQGTYSVYSYAYTNFEGMSKNPWASSYGYPTGPGYGSTPELHLNFGTKVVTRTRFLLTGNGPDGQSNFPTISYNGCQGLKALVEQTENLFNTYDPTNGTMSAGDIFRTE